MHFLKQKSKEENKYFIYANFNLRMLALIIFTYFGIQFIIDMLNNNISEYNYSDSIINEIFLFKIRKTKISLKCYFINIIGNIVLFIFHIFGKIIILKGDKKLIIKLRIKKLKIIIQLMEVD